MANIKYSEEITDKICDLLSSDYSEREICECDGMPDRESLRRWRVIYPEFAAKCARARVEQGHYIVDDLAYVEQKTLDGAIPPDVARVVISSKQWRAKKLAPKVYGDKLELGGDQNSPITLVIKRLTDA